jgi:hypothetical protein
MRLKTVHWQTRPTRRRPRSGDPSVHAYAKRTAPFGNNRDTLGSLPPGSSGPQAGASINPMRRNSSTVVVLAGPVPEEVLLAVGRSMNVTLIRPEQSGDGDSGGIEAAAGALTAWRAGMFELPDYYWGQAVARAELAISMSL